jgi:hypothetical protein
MLTLFNKHPTMNSPCHEAPEDLEENKAYYKNIFNPLCSSCPSW